MAGRRNSRAALRAAAPLEGVQLVSLHNLHVGGTAIQSAMRIDDPDDLERELRRLSLKLAEALDAGHEGIMVKAVGSTYQAGRRGKSWRKVKLARTFDLVVLGGGPGGYAAALYGAAKTAYPTTLIAGLLVTATHVPLGMQVLSRGIVFIDLAIAQIAGLGVIAADWAGFEPQGWGVQVSALIAAIAGGLLLFSIAFEMVFGLRIERLFPGYSIKGRGLFRVIRDSEVEVDDDVVAGARRALDRMLAVGRGERVAVATK